MRELIHNAFSVTLEEIKSLYSILKQHEHDLFDHECQLLRDIEDYLYERLSIEELEWLAKGYRNG